MFKKLDEIVKREEFLSEQLLNPYVIADMGVWQKYSKEHSDLRETADKYREYVETERQMNDAFALAEEETDAEMKKMLLVSKKSKKTSLFHSLQTSILTIN